MIRIVIMSDTHKQHHHPLASPPAGDVLIHCGDFTMHGDSDDLIEFDQWLSRQPHKTKLVVFGNHDQTCDRGRPEYFVEGNRDLITSALVLEDSGVTVDGVSFWGMPFHPMFTGWPQATFGRNERELREHCDLIPAGTDVLITHGPPYGICDVAKTHTGELQHVGCRALLAAANRVKPRIHCFGHIHVGGRRIIGRTAFINAALHDEVCSIVRSPIIVDIDVLA